MPRRSKVVVWVVVFAALAAVGAFVASRTDPFPPGVEDPGDRTVSPSTTASPGPAAVDPRYEITLRSTSRHVLHVGGTCRSSWQGSATVDVGNTGKLQGTGVFRLVAAGCSSPVAQIQIERLRIAVTGALQGATLQMRFAEVTRSPEVAQDLGGLVVLLAKLRPEMSTTGATGKIIASQPDGNLGRFEAELWARATCDRGC